MGTDRRTQRHRQAEFIEMVVGLIVLRAESEILSAQSIFTSLSNIYLNTFNLQKCRLIQEYKKQAVKPLYDSLGWNDTGSHLQT